MTRRAAIAAFAALAVVLVSCGAGGDGAPKFTAPVVDAVGAIDDNVEASLNARLESFRANVGPQVAVLVIDSTGSKSLEDYSIDIAREWGIGDAQRDDGVLLLIALDDRTLRIETGSGIEGDLTDVEAGRIIDGVVVPQLKNDDPTAAVAAGVEALTTELSGQVYDYPDEAPVGGTTTTGSTQVGIGSVIFGLFIMAFFVLGLLGTVIRGRRRGLGALDILSLIYVFTRSSGGGFGGGHGGFGGGGGGGFSGGGASGSW